MDRLIPIVGGILWAIWFGRIALILRRRGNGQRDREPVMWALTWLGITVAVQWIALIGLVDFDLELARHFTRFWIPIVGMVPLGVVVSHLMRSVWRHEDYRD